MRTIVTSALLIAVLTVAAAQEKDYQPSCTMCPGTYIPSTEIDAYVKRGFANDLTDQQIRQLSVGKSNVGIAVVTRKKLVSANVVAEHDLVSEVYHVISGSGTLVLGPDIVGRERRPATMQTVIEFNGPGHGGTEVRGGTVHELKPGDVVVIPAGTGHWFTRIDDHISYLMVRFDPEEVTPVRSEAQSRAYLGARAPAP